MPKEFIYTGSDHAGLKLKSSVNSFLIQLGYGFSDVGPYDFDPEDDFTVYAEKLCGAMLKSKAMGSEHKGILVCGTGQGMARAADKFPGIYAEVCPTGDFSPLTNM